MLVLLLATCETAVDRLGRADAQVDDELVRDLERVIERTQTELRALDG
jgi:hypothetical protein